MKNRFITKQKKQSGRNREPVLPALFFLGIILLFWQGFRGVGDTADVEKLRAAQQAVVRTTVQCYAIEGRYPPNVQYLSERYGLRIDEQRYIVHYNRFADNLMPEIRVLPRNLSQAETEWGGDIL